MLSVSNFIIPILCQSSVLSYKNPSEIIISCPTEITNEKRIYTNFHVESYGIRNVNEDDRSRFQVAEKMDFVVMLEVVCKAKAGSSETGFYDYFWRSWEPMRTEQEASSITVMHRQFSAGSRPDGECPESHPHLFLGGDYCCQGNVDKADCDQEVPFLKARWCCEVVMCQGCHKTANSACLKDNLPEKELLSGDVWRDNEAKPNKCKTFDKLSVYNIVQEEEFEVQFEVDEEKVALVAVLVIVILLNVLVGIFCVGRRILRRRREGRKGEDQN